MKRFFSILVLSVLALSASAQSDRRFWSQGPLTWNDFTVMPSAQGDRSYFQYNLGYNPVHDTLDGIRCQYYRAESWMLPGSSWVVAVARDNSTLRYNQVLFDMLEVECRHLQQAINANPDAFAYGNLLTNASTRLNSRIAHFRQLSHDGTDTAALSAFERQVAAELAHLPADYRPRYTARPFGYGMYVGLGVTGSTGSLGKVFSPGVGLNLGFDFSCNRHLFIFDGILGYCRVRRSTLLTDNNGEHLFAEGSLCGIATINFGYGYRVVDKLNCQLAPFVALGIREFTYNPQNEEKGFAEARPEPVVGIQFRRHLWQQRSFPQYSGLFRGDRISELSRISLHGCLMLSYSSFPDLEGRPTGLSLQAQVSASFSGRLFNVD